MRRALAPVVLVLLVGGCGYFNSLYNANRRFADAERAALNGDGALASREYRAAIDRAAVSYRQYPEGRWADDALLLLGRARFALGEYAAAAAAMRTLLGQSGERSMRSQAHAYLGASLYRLGEHTTARVHLDSAVTAFGADTDEGAFVRLWRARAAFEGGDAAGGWAGLDAAVRSQRTAREAALEGATRALEARDSARAAVFMQHLADSRAAGRMHQQVDTIVRRMAEAWSPAIAFHVSAPLAAARWPAAARDALMLTRAEVALRADAVDEGLELVLRVAHSVTGGAGSRARRLAAGILLHRADSLAELEDARVLLLPAFDDHDALELMRRIRAVQILVQDGEDPANSLSLFAAAEFLRDDVGAPHLARTLFMQFASRQPQSIWAGKAVLAAHLQSPAPATAAALEQYADNPYILAAHGGLPPAGAIDRAEERLAFGLAGLRTDALAEAVRRDVIVGRAVAALDSTRAAARSDSVRIACGLLIDSLRIAGIRADSTRSACLRGDAARVAFVLAADTLLLGDTTAVDPRSPGQRRRAAPDTTAH